MYLPDYTAIARLLANGQALRPIEFWTCPPPVGRGRKDYRLGERARDPLQSIAVIPFRLRGAPPTSENDCVGQ